MHLDLFISLRSRCFLNNVLCSCIKCDLSWLQDNMEIKRPILSIGNRYPVRLACKKGALCLRMKPRKVGVEREARAIWLLGKGALRLPSLQNVFLLEGSGDSVFKMWPTGFLRNT